MWRKQAGLGLALGALLLAGCGALGWDQRETQTVATPGGQVPAGGYASTMLPGNVGARDKDALFVAEAAHDSASEIEMSRVAEQRATSQATKDYARMIVEDHAAANRQLMELAQRENLPLPGTPSAGVAQKTDEMQTAKADGFDLDYMTRMVENHNRALNMYRDVANSSQDPNLRAWAASQIPILEKHQRQGMVLADTLNKSAKKTAAQ